MAEELGFSGIERLELVGGGVPGPIGPTGPVGPVGPAGPMPAPTYNGVQAITTAPITLKGVNEWSVASPVQITLTTVPAGSQHTVHVTSGFQNITWPNGTQVYGETEEQEVWVTLVRGASNWFVLIPSDSAASIDTGWVTVLNAANLGEGVQFTVGDASMIATGWTVTTATMLASVNIRRTGNFFLVQISGGFTADAGASSTFLSLPKPVGIVGDSTNMSYLNTATVSGTKVPTLYQCNVPTEANGRIPIQITGAVTTGMVAASQGPLMFLISPASTWGA